MLRPIEKGQVAYRHAQGLPSKYHARLKLKGRTLAILQGDTQQEANERAERLVEVLIPCQQGITIEPA